MSIACEVLCQNPAVHPIAARELLLIEKCSHANR
jgi:hypothetical protein